jgi:hypothetical protein
MTIFVIFSVVWLLVAGFAVFSAVVLQKRSVGPAILTGLLLGPLAMYVIPRLPLRQRTPGWYPWWDGSTYRHRYWDGQAWTDQFVSDWTSKPTASSVPPPGWYPNPDGTEGQRWWNGRAWN